MREIGHRKLKFNLFGLIEINTLLFLGPDPVWPRFGPLIPGFGVKKLVRFRVNHLPSFEKTYTFEDNERSRIKWSYWSNPAVQYLLAIGAVFY